MNPLFGAVASIIDKIIPDPAAAAEAKLKMFTLEQEGKLGEIAAAVKVLVAESQAGGLASQWRPIVMLVFTALIVARWFGWSAPNISEAEILQLWEIVKLGLGGYVVGRSAEKIVPVLADAIKARKGD